MASDGPTNPGAWAGLKELGPQIAVWTGLLAGMIGSLFGVGYKFKRHGERIEALELAMQGEREARELAMDRQMKSIEALLRAHQEANGRAFEMISQAMAGLAASQTAATKEAEEGRRNLYGHIKGEVRDLVDEMRRSEDRTTKAMSEVRAVVQGLSSKANTVHLWGSQQQGEEG